MNSVNKNETYLILERSNAPLKSLKENNEYILEGIFTSFDVLNENQRIYQWKEFEPHFKVLHEKIKNGKTVYGNADHPASPMSEPRLLDAAIILKNLEYDKINNCVNGRVKVLDTNAGKQIKAIMDGGGQVSISSRALGSVRENKTVAIERLITYDLVAEPGFANANLTRVNESFGILNENIGIFKIPITENAIINDAVENKAEENKEVQVTLNGSLDHNSTTETSISIIFVRGQRGPATFAVTNYLTASALADGSQYIIAKADNEIVQNKSLYPVGTLLNGISLYVDPYMMPNDNRVLVGRKGGPEELGVKLGLYIMAEIISTIAEGTMSPKIAAKSRYALVPAGFHCETQYFTFYVNNANQLGIG